MLLTRPVATWGVVVGLVALGVSAGSPDPRAASAHAGSQTSAPSFRVEHTPPACVLAEKASRVVACVVPRSRPANLRVSFRAEGGTAWYSAPLRSDVPCYTGLLPRPSRATSRVSYFVEAEGRDGEKARTPEYEVAVVADPAACPGRVAASAPPGKKAAWDTPPGEARVPPGFEGALPPARTGSAPSSPTITAPAPKPPPASTATPAPPAPGPPPAPPSTTSASKSGGHGHRTAALVTAGVAVAGGAAVVATRSNDTAVAPPPAASGLPPTGVSGVYLGTETINYAGGCVGTDDVVLNLQEAGGSLSGVLTFTVRTCPCCAAGRGANPVSGSLSGTSLQMATPIGFSYSGMFAGNHLTGALAGPGGVTGSWSVDKR